MNANFDTLKHTETLKSGGRIDKLEAQLIDRMDELEEGIISLRRELCMFIWGVSAIFAIVLAMLG